MVRTLNTCGTVRKRYINIALTCLNNYEAMLSTDIGQIFLWCKVSTINNDIYKPVIHKQKDGKEVIRRVYAYLMHGDKKIAYTEIGNSNYSGMMVVNGLDNSGSALDATTYRVKLVMVNLLADGSIDTRPELEAWLADKPPISVVFAVC